MCLVSVVALVPHNSYKQLYKYRAVQHLDAKKKKMRQEEEQISHFCESMNEIFGCFIIPPIREYLEPRPTGSAGRDPLSIVTASPEAPLGLSRPVWLTVAASLPTGLLWYGYYKYCIEEELFQNELQTTGKVTGCGGAGTLLPFVFGILIGFPLKLIHLPLGDFLLSLSSIWILLTQINLYRRVNELLPEPVLWEWWALLPPPLDVVVGLRQVHFLSVFWQSERGEPRDRDYLADDLFPFISYPERFTLKKFFRTPSMWFWFTKDIPDLDFDFLQDDYDPTANKKSPTEKPAFFSSSNSLRR